MPFDHDRAHTLHDRLIVGDRIASADLADLVLPELRDRLARRWPNLSNIDAVHDAAVEVFVRYLRDPGRYDPSRSSLVGWLQLQAHRDLTNDYRSLRRNFHDRCVGLGWDVEGEESARKLRLVTVDEYPSDEEREILDDVLDALTDPTDRRLLALIIDGDHSTSAAAAALGITHLPPEEQQVLAKQNKDRVKAKVKRHLRSRP